MCINKFKSSQKCKKNSRYNLQIVHVWTILLNKNIKIKINIYYLSDHMLVVVVHVQFVKTLVPMLVVDDNFEIEIQYRMDGSPAFVDNHPAIRLL
jgi:hypothetical protein